MSFYLQANRMWMCQRHLRSHGQSAMLTPMLINSALNGKMNSERNKLGSERGVALGRWPRSRRGFTKTLKEDQRGHSESFCQWTIFKSFPITDGKSRMNSFSFIFEYVTDGNMQRVVMSIMEMKAQRNVSFKLELKAFLFKFNLRFSRRTVIFATHICGHAVRRPSATVSAALV